MRISRTGSHGIFLYSGNMAEFKINTRGHRRPRFYKKPYLKAAANDCQTSQTLSLAPVPDDVSAENVPAETVDPMVVCGVAVPDDLPAPNVPAQAEEVLNESTGIPTTAHPGSSADLKESLVSELLRQIEEDNDWTNEGESEDLDDQHDCGDQQTDCNLDEPTVLSLI